MRRIKLFIFLISCVFSISISAQEEYLSLDECRQIDSKGIVSRACSRLFASKNTDYLDPYCCFKGICNTLKKYGKDKVMNAISDAEVFSYGYLMDSIVLIRLDNEEYYFRVDIDPPFYKNIAKNIESIYDSEGKDTHVKNSYMHFPGVINDADGFVNIRSQRDSASSILGKIHEDEIFYFTPTSKSNWYRVELPKKNIVGYVHKSRIKWYRDCSDSIKRKIEHFVDCECN